jgi:hypothetical protein
VNPLKDLSGVKTRMAQTLKRLFQFGQFAAGDVGSRLCHHGAPCPEERTTILLRVYDAPEARP